MSKRRQRICETRASFGDLRAISSPERERDSESKEGGSEEGGKGRERRWKKESRERQSVGKGVLCYSGCSEREYQNGKRLTSINHVYSGPMSQVTVVHYVNARVHPLPLSRPLSLSLLPAQCSNRQLMGGYRFLEVHSESLLRSHPGAMTQLRNLAPLRTHARSTHANSRPDGWILSRCLLFGARVPRI